MKSLVIDASAALALVLEDEKTPQVFSALPKWEAFRQLYVPGHFWGEVANGLLMSERRGRASQAQSMHASQMVQDLSLTLDEEAGFRSASAATSIAREFALTVYDAAYLELAIRHRSALATIDKALARAAKESGIELVIKN